MKYLNMMLTAMMTLLVIFMLSCTGHAATMTKSDEASVRIQIKDLREIVTYTAALEAENKAVKESLEKERAAVEEMINENRKVVEAYGEYSKTIEEKTKLQEKLITQQKQSIRTRNCIIGVAIAAIIVLSAGR